MGNSNRKKPKHKKSILNSRPEGIVKKSTEEVENKSKRRRITMKDIEPDNSAFKKKQKERKNNKKSVLSDVKTKADQILNDEKEKVKKEKRGLKQRLISFAKSIVGFRGKSTRKEFWSNFLLLSFLMALFMLLASGSAMSTVIMILYMIFATSLICRRVHDVGLKWFTPVIVLAGALISFIVSILVTAGLTTAGDSNMYNAIINGLAAQQMTDSNVLAESATFMGITIAIAFVFFIFMIVICCFPSERVKMNGKSGKSLTIIYLILGLLPCILFPFGCYSVMSQTNQAIDDASHQMYASMFKKNDDGTYSINGLFSGKNETADINEIAGDYRNSMSNQELTKQYKETASYFVEYSDGVKIIAVFGQNATKSGQVVGLLELGLLKTDNNSHKIIVENVNVDGTDNLIKQEFSLDNELNFLPLEVSKLKDGSNIIITTKENGETKILKATLMDLTTDSSSQTTQQSQTQSPTQ